MKRMWCAWTAVLVLSILSGPGCFTAPERIDVQVGSPRPEPVDTTQVPPDYNGAVTELRKSHREIDYLRDKVRKLEDDKKKLKQEKEECEKKYDRLKDKYK
jgi:hypothetical protein